MRNSIKKKIINEFTQNINQLNLKVELIEFKNNT